MRREYAQLLWLLVLTGLAMLVLSGGLVLRSDFVTFAQSPVNTPAHWYDVCPHSPDCSPIQYPPQEPYPTATAQIPQGPWAIQPTYTVVPTPPCRETATCEPDVPPTPLPTLTAVPTNTLIPSPTPYPTATDYPPQPADW